MDNGARALRCLDDRLLGHRISSVDHSEDGTWVFSLTSGATLAVECGWRIVAGGKLAVASADDDQSFGLGAPLDAAERAGKFLSGGTLDMLSVRAETGDLVLTFADGVRLEVINRSSGFEAWQVDAQPMQASPAPTVVCMGDGRVVLVEYEGSVGRVRE
ncbi:MAG TPA: DUF6188 family protein [Phenylobacterium sp.]